jgi:hypothetical protein
MTEKPGRYDVGSSPLRPQPPLSFEAQLKALPQSAMCNSIFQLIGG